ncbi:MAG: hypothetical protein MJE77_01380 [Proteobacteria bacterium]|nr:hypothetical protein [Pseudomonadota bacterium]
MHDRREKSEATWYGLLGEECKALPGNADRPGFRFGRRIGRARSVALYALLGCVLMVHAACEGPGPVRVGNATLAVLLLGSDPMPADAENAPTVQVLRGQPTTIPNDPVVKLAIDRLVPWAKVQAVLKTIEDKKQKPVLLVAQRFKVRAFHLNDELLGPAIEVYAQMEGKICVKHPDVREAKCNQGLDETYIDPAFTRGLVREAVNGYQRTNVRVDLPDMLTWGDVVASVGGARSCCGKRAIRVKLMDDQRDGPEPRQSEHSVGF